jgi:hypothetical protein
VTQHASSIAALAFGLCVAQISPYRRPAAWVY